jgi:hypothetical protein
MDYVCRAGPFAARIGQGGRWPANGGNRPNRIIMGLSRAFLKVFWREGKNAHKSQK